MAPGLAVGRTLIAVLENGQQEVMASVVLPQSHCTAIWEQIGLQPMASN